MQMLKALREKSKFFYVYLVGFSILNSLSAYVLLHFINLKLVGDPLPFWDQYDVFVFGAVVLASFLLSSKFEVYLIEVNQRIEFDLSTYLFDYLRHSDYEKYQALSEEKVRTALFDVRVLQGLPRMFLGFLKSGIMVVVGIGYLLMNNFIAASVLLSLMVMVFIAFIVQLKLIQKDKLRNRALFDVHKRLLNDFLRGFRELKISILRNENIFKRHIFVNLRERMETSFRYLSRMVKFEVLSKHVVFAIIGIILFLFSEITLFDASSQTVFVTTFIFLSGPIASMINNINSLNTVFISVGRLKEFEEILMSQMPEGEHAACPTEWMGAFREITFDQVQFAYTGQGSANRFELNIPNIRISSGEILFVTGGNGSGKSTFINLLTGILKPSEGNILYNGSVVKATNYLHYRDQISAIFQDNHLFTENYDDFDLSEGNSEFTSLVKEMKLAEKLDLSLPYNKMFTRLSKGQQKRLALIYAFLENKQLLIFDEWAAEQDPAFRRYFYQVIIPKLKEMGKTVVAITHDDAYFDSADRILKFEYGSIVQDYLIEKEKLVMA